MHREVSARAVNEIGDTPSSTSSTTLMAAPNIWRRPRAIRTIAQRLLAYSDSAARWGRLASAVRAEPRSAGTSLAPGDELCSAGFDALPFRRCSGLEPGAGRDAEPAHRQHHRHLDQHADDGRERSA